jgi:4-hydroxy-tetrahydrodipicolinate synthase
VRFRAAPQTPRSDGRGNEGPHGLNADLCARFYRSGDAASLREAITIRTLFDGKPLVPGVKALLAHIRNESQWARVAPPLTPFPPTDRMAVVAGYKAVRAQHLA